MRPRFNIPVISISGSTVMMREPKSSQEKGIRRANFEKQYKKNQVVFMCIKKTPELQQFSNKIAAEIAEFKKQKLTCKQQVSLLKTIIMDYYEFKNLKRHKELQLMWNLCKKYWWQLLLLFMFLYVLLS